MPLSQACLGKLIFYGFLFRLKIPLQSILRFSPGEVVPTGGRPERERAS